MSRASALRIAVAIAMVTTSSACRQDMHDQPRFEPLEASVLFADGRSARPLVEGTVAQGHLNADEHLYTGRVNGELATTFPFPVTAEVLARGQERYHVFCAPCHDQTGSGQGMVVQRGFRPPTSYHIERLRQAPPGYFFDVITSGYGVMYSYAARIPPRDRWAIAAWIRVLQLSQNATVADVPADKRAELTEGQP